jgi:hypothetical protein
MYHWVQNSREDIYIFNIFRYISLGPLGKVLALCLLRYQTPRDHLLPVSPPIPLRGRRQGQSSSQESPELQRQLQSPASSVSITFVSIRECKLLLLLRPRRSIYYVRTSKPFVSIMLFSSLPHILACALLCGVSAASDDKPKPVDPCTISSASGSFFDLRSLSIQPVPPGTTPGKNQKTDSWHAKGYDYKSNFTLNVCAPVVETLDNVQGVDKDLWKNVSAYYEVGSKQYSLG